MTEPNVQKLLTECREALKYSYSPYSHFAVGAALESVDGVIYRGCNIESVSQSPTICAERTAMVKAISDGVTKFKAIAVTSNVSAPDICSPCGVCRQFIREFSSDLTIYLVRPDMTYLKTSIEELLPMSFVPEVLVKGVKK